MEGKNCQALVQVRVQAPVPTDPKLNKSPQKMKKKKDLDLRLTQIINVMLPVRGVVRVQPEHVDAVVIPKTHNQHVAPVQ